MEVPHEIWLQLAQWFQRRYLNTHTHTHIHTYIHRQTDIHTSETLYPLPAYKHTLTREPSALNKTVQVFLHTRTQELRVFPDDKKYGAGLWRQSIIYLWWVAWLFFFSFFPAMMNKQNIGSLEKLSPCEYTVLYPGKIRLKLRLF